jgi:hypothetical protein
MFEIGKTIRYQGRLHVVVGVTPIGATPCLLELEDAESGRVLSVDCDDPELMLGEAEPPATLWVPKIRFRLQSTPFRRRAVSFEPNSRSSVVKASPI